MDPTSDMASDLAHVPWQELYRMEDCNEQMNFLYDKLYTTLDVNAPLQEIKYSKTDRPWVTPYCKKLVMDRDTAFNFGNKYLQ